MIRAMKIEIQILKQEILGMAANSFPEVTWGFSIDSIDVGDVE